MTDAKRPHADRWKDVLERAIRWYFGQALEPLGVRCAGGYADVGGWERQLDVVAIADPSTGTWNIDLTVVELSSTSRVLMHVEVAYRASWKHQSAKVVADAKQLLGSIRRSASSRSIPPWTALVLLGGAPDDDLAIMRAVHRVHRATRVSRRRHGRHFFYFPMIDAVVLPSVCYLKHDVFESPQLERGPGRRWPVFMPVPTTSDVPLRGLAIASARMAHRVRGLRRRAPLGGPAWPHARDASLYGPSPLVAGRRDPDLLVSVADLGRSRRLWHAGHDRHSNRWIATPLMTDNTRLARGGRVTRFALRADPSGP